MAESYQDGSYGLRVHLGVPGFGKLPDKFGRMELGVYTAYAQGCSVAFARCIGP